MKVANRRAFFKYQILDRYEAGLKLAGHEVKSIKQGRIKLDFAFVKIIGSEAYLVNAEIPLFEGANVPDYDAKRTRKLLLHKKQIIAFKTKMSHNKLTIVPVSCYTRRGLVKLEIALAKGKGKRDRREEIKKRELQREVARELRGKG